MKKQTIFFIFFLWSMAAMAQDNYPYYGYSGEISLPRIRDYENFFFSEWELNPAEMSNKLSEVEKDKKNRSLTYLIDKDKNGLTQVVTEIYGHKFSEATYKNGVLDGLKTINHNNGMPFQEIQFKNGKVNGVCKIYNTDSKLVLETNYKDNLKNGIRRLYNSRRDHEILEGTFVNGNLVGDLKYITDSSLHILPNDMKNGIVKSFYNNQLVLEYEIVEGKTHGIVKRYNPKTGTVIEKIPYYLGERNGTTEMYNLQGELINQYTFKNGKRIGAHKTYSNDKQLRKEEYYDDNGLKNGTWKEYDKDGILTLEQQYKNDSLNGVSKRFNKGFLQEISTYQNGKRNGLAHYYKSGTPILTSDVYYSNDKFYKEINYYESGAIFSERNNNPITKEVSVKYYYPDGTFFYENKFSDTSVGIGLVKYIEMIDNTICVRTETEYDGKKNRVYQKSYGYNRDGSYTEYHFRNNTWHGLCRSYNAATKETKDIYYYETNKTYRIVTKEAFEALTAAEKH